ncbi:MAG: hypothetical protein IT377_32840 [Polyangiaceae bacterium]|nr:hypothetical protein [Polyangiaceae bacterium]
MLIGALAIAVAAGLTFTVPAAAATDTSSLCGGDNNKKKEVKKPAPAPQDPKAPQNPA